MNFDINIALLSNISSIFKFFQLSQYWPSQHCGVLLVSFCFGGWDVVGLQDTDCQHIPQHKCVGKFQRVDLQQVALVERHEPWLCLLQQSLESALEGKFFFGHSLSAVEAITSLYHIFYIIPIVF